MDKVIKFFQKLFSFSHSEAKGFVRLLIVCLVAIAVILVPKFINKKPTALDPQESLKMDSLVLLLEKAGISHENNVLFRFDPNRLPVDSLELLGFTRKVAERIDNYREKGGRFYTKEDLKKIYGLSDQLYNQVKTNIDLPDSGSVSSQKNRQLSIDINEADNRQLKEIYMVGDVLASRIVKYREVLGGYIGEEQLDEVFGLSDVALRNVKSSVFIHPGFSPRLIKVNSDSLNVLKSHPYISDQLAEDIVRFREINNSIESEKVLANFKSVDKSNFKKLIFYLDFQ